MIIYVVYLVNSAAITRKFALISRIWRIWVVTLRVNPPAGPTAAPRCDSAQSFWPLRALGCNRLVSVISQVVSLRGWSLLVSFCFQSIAHLPSLSAQSSCLFADPSYGVLLVTLNTALIHLCVSKIFIVLLRVIPLTAHTILINILSRFRSDYRWGLRLVIGFNELLNNSYLYFIVQYTLYTITLVFTVKFSLAVA
jgi:hypothetical protein